MEHPNYYNVITFDGKNHFCQEILNTEKDSPLRVFLTSQNINIFCLNSTENPTDYLKYGYCYTKEEYITPIDQDPDILTLIFKVNKIDHLLDELQSVIYKD